RLGIRDAITIAANAEPHSVTITVPEHVRPSHRVLAGVGERNGDMAVASPADSVIRFSILDQIVVARAFRPWLPRRGRDVPHAPSPLIEQDGRRGGEKRIDGAAIEQRGERGLAEDAALVVAHGEAGG